MKDRVRFISAALFVFSLFPAAAFAEQDFYGIQFKDETWARSLVLGGPAGPAEDLKQGPVLNQAVRAEASLKEVEDRHVDFRITVFNDSSEPVSADHALRDFFIFTKDGKKFPLIDEDETRSGTIEPKNKLSLAPSLGNLRIDNDNVEMIVVSLDLGRSRIFLFPWSKKEMVSKLVSPAPPAPPAPAPAPVKAEAPKKEPKPKKEEPEQGPRRKTPKRNFWDWLKLDKNSRKDPVRPTATAKQPVQPTAVEPAPGPGLVPSSAPASPAGAQQKLDDAIKNFKYVPSASESAPVPVSQQVHTPLPGPSEGRTEAQVIGFNKTYKFVTMNLGSRDGLKADTTVSIVRNGKLLAKAQVKQVREAVAAATILPGTLRGDIEPGDRISLA